MMRISDKIVQEILLDSKKLDESGLSKLSKDATRQKKSLQEIAISHDVISEPELTKLYAQKVDIPFVSLDPAKIDVELLKTIPERIARRYDVVIYGKKDQAMLLAMDDPDDVQAISDLQKELNTKLEVAIASKSNILSVLDLYRGNIEGELTKVISEDEETEAIDEDVDEEDVAEDSPIAQTVNLLIDYAVKSSASDIHIEPRENYVQIRYRVDGVLREADRLPKKVQAALISRIKILSNLKIDEHRVPQDGRFKVSVNDRVFALRVSVLPIADGEKVVIRLLNESSKAADLTGLGFWGYSLETMKEAMVQPHGIILVTGPTGSGKSTTLFSTLSLLNDSTVNISTVEDPIEYKIFGANQTQVNPKAGMTFASGLRSLLRQDPNIIMVGEVRDHETADLAIQAALTGHLVFSTLHTNNAATCLPRLLDMGIEPFLIASTARAVIGQRLVRKLCDECKKSYIPEKEEVAGVADVFHLSSTQAWQYLAKLEQQASQQSIGDSKDLAISGTTINHLWRAGEEGCEACNHTGFKGRIGIYEVLNSTTEIQKMIIQNVTSDDIQAQAIKEGMVTMQTDGLVKALRGWTTTEEILRVTRE